jgi:peptidoglycan hydrolase CwlO-like protein
VELLKDRNYYRTDEDRLLIEEAKYNPNYELAVVLAERLEEVQVEFDKQLDEATERAADLQIDLNQLDDKVYLLQQEIARNEITITSMASEIAYLKEQNND